MHTRAHAHMHTCTHMPTPHTTCLATTYRLGLCRLEGVGRLGSSFPAPQPQLRARPLPHSAPAHSAPLGWWSSPACALCGFTFELPAPPTSLLPSLRGVSGGLCPLCNRGPRSTVSSGSYNEEGTPWAPQGSVTPGGGAGPPLCPLTPGLCALPSRTHAQRSRPAMPPSTSACRGPCLWAAMR